MRARLLGANARSRTLSAGARRAAADRRRFRLSGPFAREMGGVSSRPRSTRGPAARLPSPL